MRKHRRIKKHRIAHKFHRKSQRKQGFFFKYFTLIFGVLVLVVLGYGFTQKRSLSQSVLGTSVFRLFNQATIPLPNIPHAVSYNVYVKTASDQRFTHAARNISATATTYTITYLRKNVSYQYKVAAVGPQGGEIWFSPTLPIINLQSM